MTDATKSDPELLDELATRLNRVGLSRIDPERFHEERNEIVVEMRRMAKRLRGDHRKDSTTVWRPTPAAPRDAQARASSLGGRASSGFNK